MSDVVQADTQSELLTKVPTWVELPMELTFKELKHLQHCVRLRRSLYGHPEAGFIGMQNSSK